MVSRMGLKDIIERIVQQRDQRIKEIARERKRKIAKIANEVEKEIKKEKTRMQDEFDEEREIYRNLKLSVAKRKVRRDLLAEKEELINQTLNDVLNRLGAFKGDSYRKILHKLVTERVDLLKGKCRVMSARREDIPFLRELGVAPVSNETVQGRGGVVIVSVDGEFRMDSTFDYLMEKKSDELRKMAAGFLFEEE